jgi:hypothetical protein
MRRRRTNKSDILIDLTSLLDVIFIVLLVVMCNQLSYSEEVQAHEAELETYEDEIKDRELEAENQYNLYSQALETQDNINQYVFAVSVYSAYDYNENGNYKERHLALLKEGEEMQSWALSESSTKEQFIEFEQALDDYISDIPDKPVLLTLNENDEKILYRDEQKILSIFNDLSEKYSNVYLRSYDEQGTEE